MNEILKPGARLLFMKVGTHASEPLDKIIERKRKEIDEVGFSMWGYGGNTCHPTTMVQPFAEEAHELHEPLIMVMQPMESNHFAAPVRARSYSRDGVKWEDIPEEINVLGSRYALFLSSIESVNFKLPLSATEVSVGRSAGRPGHLYVRGRVDKACLTVVSPTGRANDKKEEREVGVGIVATLKEPYAAFLKT